MKKKDDSKKIGFLGAASIGVGGMVGGGIFAVLGLSVSLAKGGVPVSFMEAGVIALLTAHAYSRLSIAFPDAGGTVRFLNEGFGFGIFSGGLNNMLWVSYIIMLALYASAFGSYSASIISITGDTKTDEHIFISAVIVISTVINYYSIIIVDEVESFAVGVKLIILLAFIAVGFWGLGGNPNLQQLSPGQWENPIQLIAGGMVIFVAYEGFELIANSAPDISNPSKNIPKAYFGSVGFVVLLYIAIAVVTVGSLPFSKIASAQDYALAEAAKPKLGQAGFTIIAIAAMISTFSAINATLLGGSRVNYEVANRKELPAGFTKQLWGKPIGLAVIAIASLLIANLVDLKSISTSGSVGFLFIFGMVNYVAWRKADSIGASKVIAFSAFLLCMMAFGVLIYHQFTTDAAGIVIALGIFVCCFIGEWLNIKVSDKAGSPK